MADNKDLSKKIELDVTLNTSGAEQKLSKLSAEADALNAKLSSGQSGRKGPMLDLKKLLSQQLFGDSTKKFSVAELSPLVTGDIEKVAKENKKKSAKAANAVADAFAQSAETMERVIAAEDDAVKLAEMLGLRSKNAQAALKKSISKISSPSSLSTGDSEQATDTISEAFAATADGIEKAIAAEDDAAKTAAKLGDGAKRAYAAVQEGLSGVVELDDDFTQLIKEIDDFARVVAQKSGIMSSGEFVRNEAKKYGMENAMNVAAPILARNAEPENPQAYGDVRHTEYMLLSKMMEGVTLDAEELALVLSKMDNVAGDAVISSIEFVNAFNEINNMLLSTGRTAAASNATRTKKSGERNDPTASEAIKEPKAVEATGTQKKIIEAYKKAMLMQYGDLGQQALDKVAEDFVGKIADDIFESILRAQISTYTNSSGGKNERRDFVVGEAQIVPGAQGTNGLDPIATNKMLVTAQKKELEYGLEAGTVAVHLLKSVSAKYGKLIGELEQTDIGNLNADVVAALRTIGTAGAFDAGFGPEAAYLDPGKTPSIQQQLAENPGLMGPGFMKDFKSFFDKALAEVAGVSRREARQGTNTQISAGNQETNKILIESMRKYGKDLGPKIVEEIVKMIRGAGGDNAEITAALDSAMQKRISAKPGAGGNGGSGGKPPVAYAAASEPPDDPWTKLFNQIMAKYGDILGSKIVGELVQILKDAGGDLSKITASWDTEFDSVTNPLKDIGTLLTQSAVTIAGIDGKFVDLFNMIHIPATPGGVDQPFKGAKYVENAPGNISELKKRGAQLGIPEAQFGTSNDGIKNLQELRDKMEVTITLVKLIDELGIKMVGSGITAAEFMGFARTAHELNKVLPEAKALILPEGFNNLVDISKVREALQAKKSAGEPVDSASELLFDLSKKGGSNKLSDLFSRAVEHFGDVINRFGSQVQITDGKISASGPGGNPLPPHVAAADTRMGIVVYEALIMCKDASIIASSMQAQYGRGGSYGPQGQSAPYSTGDKGARGQYPTAFGDGGLKDLTDTAIVKDNVKAIETGADKAKEAVKGLKEESQKAEEATMEQRQEMAKLAAETAKVEELGKGLTEASQGRKNADQAAKQSARKSPAFKSLEKAQEDVQTLLKGADEVFSASSRARKEAEKTGEAVKPIIAGEDRQAIISQIRLIDKYRGSLADTATTTEETRAQTAPLRRALQQATDGLKGLLTTSRSANKRGIIEPRTAYQAQLGLRAVNDEIENQKKLILQIAVADVNANSRKQKAGKDYYNTQVAINEAVAGGAKIATDASGRQIDNSQRSVLALQREDKARKDASNTIKRSLKEQVDAERAVQKATKDSLNTWVTGRYALYDVGNAYQNVSRNMFMAARRIFDLTQAYRSYETAFTSVERAMQLDMTGTAAQGAVELKDAFIELSQRIPVAFEELSRIATLGAQMGISAGGIVQFTETVAQFASVTGITADEVAQKFGKIAELANIDSSQFQNLGSAVAFAGVNAVATESEILTLSESIAAVSNQVGMTAPDVIGLATSLASIGVPAEQARGVFTRVFADIDRAVASGGKSLSTFADIAGMSVKDFSAAWGQQGESYNVFRAMLGGISTAENMTKTFDALNITETREVNTLTRLAKNLNVVDQAAGDATASFNDAKFLGDSFEKTVDNLDSKILMFQSTLKSLGEEMMKGLAPAFGYTLEVMSGMAKFAKDMAKNPFLQVLSGTSIGTLVAVGAFTGLTAVLAKVTAQIYAFRVAMIQSATDPTATAGIGSKIKQLVGFSSTLVEMRDQLQRADSSVRGDITPVNFKTSDTIADFRKGHKERQKYMMETANVYLATGDKMVKADDFKKAKDLERVQLARQEADQITELQRLRASTVEQLVTETGRVNDAQHARAQALLANREGAKALDIENAKRIVATRAMDLENAAILESTKNGKIYYRWVEKNGQMVAKMTPLSRVYWAQEVVAGRQVANLKQQETAKRILNRNAIDMETRSASIASKGLVGIGSRLLGGLGTFGAIASVITMITGLIGGLVTAAEEAAKIDLAGSGFGLEAVRDAIQQDTEAWMKSGEAISIHSSSVEVAKQGISDYSRAVSYLSGESLKATSAQYGLGTTVKATSVAFGQATKALLVNSIVSNEKIKELILNAKDVANVFSGVNAGAESFVDKLLGSPEVAQQALRDIWQQVKDIDNELKNMKPEIAVNWSDESGTGTSYVFSAEQSARIEQLNGQKDAIHALGVAGSEALAQLEKAAAMSKVMDIINGYSEEFFGLDTALKTAMKTGKGMKKVLTDIANAAALMAGGAMSPELLNQLKTAKSVDEMLKFVKAAHNAIIAQKILQMTNAGATAGFGEVKSGLEGVIGQFTNLSNTSNETEDALNKQGGAAETLTEKMKRLLDSVFASTNALINMNSAVRGLGASMAGGNSWSAYTEQGAKNLGALQSALGAIAEKGGKNAVKSLQLFRDALKQSGAGAPAIAKVDAYIKKLGGDSTLTSKQLNKLKKSNIDLYNSFKKLLKEGLEGTTNGLRTLGEYASELAGVMREAFNFKFGTQSALDGITSGWLSLKDAVDQANNSLKEANATVYELTSTGSSLETQLQIAIEYGDKIREDAIRAEIEKNKVALENAKKEVEKLKNATNLTGNDETSIGNRDKMRNMVSNYIAYLEQLAASGLSEAELAAQAEKLGKEFMDNAIAAGFKPEDIQQYADTVGTSFKTIIERVNKGTTLKVDTDPALRALEEFSKKANKALKKIGTVTIEVSSSVDGTQKKKKALGGLITGPGSSMSDSIPAMLSNGEYVVRASAVSAYGVDFLNSLNQQRVSFDTRMPAQPIQAGGGDSQVVYLSPEDRQLLRAAIDRPVNLYTENTKIAQSANAGNVLLARRGVR